jgi:ketosteroid isomerase-like protein
MEIVKNVMKNSIVVTPLLFFLFLQSYLSAQTMRSNDTVALRHEFEMQTQKWMDAYNSKNAQNLVPLYTVDADYISGHVKGLEANGRDKLIANFQNGMDMGGHIDAVEILSMQLSCDLATLLCRYQATNSGVTVVGRNLLVLKKVDGIWLIVLHITVV